MARQWHGGLAPDLLIRRYRLVAAGVRCRPSVLRRSLSPVRVVTIVSRQVRVVRLPDRLPGAGHHLLANNLRRGPAVSGSWPPPAVSDPPQSLRTAAVAVLRCCTAERTKRVLWGLVPGGDLVQLSGGALGVVQNASRPQPAIVGRQSPPVSQDRGRVGDVHEGPLPRALAPGKGPPSAAMSIVCSTSLMITTTTGQPSADTRATTTFAHSKATPETYRPPATEKSIIVSSRAVVDSGWSVTMEKFSITLRSILRSWRTSGV
jgi:hypothetical protein